MHVIHSAVVSVCGPKCHGWNILNYYLITISINAFYYSIYKLYTTSKVVVKQNSNSNVNEFSVHS